MNVKKFTLFLTAFCLAIPSYAQKGKNLPQVLSRKVQTTRLNYHPVFGYPVTYFSKDLITVFPVTSAKVHEVDFNSHSKIRLIQTAPILSSAVSHAFSYTKDLSTQQLAEGC